MLYHQPRVFRPNGSIGIFGTNTPEEVRALQNLMINAGYNHINGNHLHSSGRCDPETEAAIIWYQRLLNMSPSGVVHPQQIWFYSMFNKAISPRWRPRDTGPLHVREGQITFDAEGKDYLTAVEPFRQPKNTRLFSRILHWPEQASGVTLGRGYDMKARSSGEIMTHLRQAGIEEYKAVICSKGAGLVGNEAHNFVRGYGPLVGEITHLQQIRLFEISYQAKKDYARGFYQRISKTIPDAPTWENIDLKIRDVVIDIFYQSVHNVHSLIEAAIKGKADLINYIANDAQYMKYEKNRNRIGYLK
ncbi:peptidoglycan-binding protein [Pseudescherichia sp.]|uniref:peptidoglycan-binding protein n=1 Tax=Pseudescherichia sp. TaxID=2055881 RepID=UPI00289B70E9|nr:peptidoglycan-binding protein [Pseudescherichia sp.]